MNIKKTILNGLKWTSLSSIIIAILQIIQISILARYLSSEDFGLMAIVMVVIGFCKIFSDMGISNAIIHHEYNTTIQLSSLYWLNILIGFFLFFLISLLSPLISSFYNEPKLTELIILLSMSFIIQSFGNQYKILFQKELNFNIIAKIEISSNIISFLTAIILVLSDNGIYSLVFSSLMNITITSLLFLFFGRKNHIPQLIFSIKEIKQYLNFGAYQTGQSTLNYFNSQFDVILIGKLLGTEALGVYSIVKQLAMRPAQIINPIITKITFPVLAKLQDNRDKLKDVYLKTIYYVTLINFPIYALLSILSEPIILILFGKEWEDAIPILRILAIYFMIRSIGNPIGSLVMAKGKVHLEFWWNVGMFLIFPLSIYGGSYWGINGVAVSLTLLMIIVVIPIWFFMVNPLCHATLKEYINSFSTNFLLTITCAVISSIPLLLIKIELMQTISFIIIFILSYSLFQYKILHKKGL